VRALGKRLVLASTLASALVMVIPSTAHASGSLDPSFGTGGAVSAHLGGTDRADDVLIQADGKIVAAGSTSTADGGQDFALTRHLADGSLDTTFGTGGTVRTDVSGTGAPDSARAVVRQPDGKLVVGGITGDGWTCRFALARYLPDGSLDSSFGTGGVVITDLQASELGGVRGLALQGDGKLVAVGSSKGVNGLQFAVVRYLANGALDPAFGSGGVVQTRVSSGYTLFADYANTVAIQPDGRIVVGGTAGKLFRPSHYEFDFAVVRYTASGALDTTFGTGGMTVGGVGPSGLLHVAEVNELAIRGDGRIVAVGFTGGTWGYSSGYDVAVARFRANGVLDTTFDTDGWVRTDVAAGSGDDAGTDLALHSDGGLLVSGTVATQQGSRFLLARYRPGGALDPTFGSGGLLVTDVNGPGNDEAYAMAKDPDGRLVVGGASRGADSDFAVARFLP
jgi:uncharacterized delta-60 repeat protein